MNNIHDNVKIMRKHIITLLLVCITVLCMGQTKNLADSLRRLLPFQKVEAARMQIKIQIGDYFEKSQPDSAFVWYKSVIPSNLNDSTAINQWFSNASEPEKYLFTLGLAKYGVISLKIKSSINALDYIGIAQKHALEINQPQIAVFCSNNLALYYANIKDNNQL